MHLMLNVCDTTPMQNTQIHIHNSCTYVVSMHYMSAIYKGFWQKTNTLPNPKSHTCIKIAKTSKFSANPYANSTVLA